MRDDRAAPHVALVPEAIRFKSFHVITPDDRGYSSGGAVVATLSHLRRTSALGRGLAALHLVWLVGALYWVVAHTKGFFARFVADGPGPDRYP
jgi:hypothetical protein